MILRRVVLAVCAVVATTLAAGVAPGPVSTAAPAAAAEDETASPLTVTLSRLTPSTIPATGRVVMTGRVRNDSQETWSAINVHPVMSTVPMTEREQLTAAATSDPTVEIGERLYGTGQFASIGDLVPGQAARFRISLAVKDLPTTGPGVYWIGVHALGQNAEGRDGVADGRARTFIPLVDPKTKQRTAVSLVVPLRERVRRDQAGRLVDTTAWSQTLGDDGRLERIAALLNTAGGRVATMLVDPAVVDAVASITADNPELSFGTDPGEPEEQESPSRSVDRLGPIDRAHATRWLAQVKSASTLQTVLGLGYADPDVASLARSRPQLVGVAAKEAAAAFERLGIDVLPAVAPASGWLDDTALDAIDPGSVVLVSDHSAPRTRTQWRTGADQDLVFTDEQAAAGGPAPTDPMAALAVRQRVVAEAALRAAAGLRSPMVVSLPADWDPGPGWQAADFFQGLNLSWLDLVSLQREPATTPTFDASLGYPASARKDEIGLANISATRTLITTAAVLGHLLRSTNEVRRGLTRMGLEAVSEHARRDPALARTEVLETNSAMRARLDKVSVVGTDFVTLSGGSGTLTVTLVNELDQPITVGIEPRTGTPDVRIATPDPLDLAPGQRTVLRLRTQASSIGVHEITLTPVTAEGEPLGRPLTFNLRTSDVGRLIWAVLLGGGGLLVVMILRRVRRGLREHRWRGQ